jgi:hypothetical protein
MRGELLKLGIDVSATTIATVFRLGGLGPAPRRIGPNWAQFLRLQAYGFRSLGTPGAEDGPEDLASDPRELSAGISTDPGTSEEDRPIHEDPPEAMRRLFAAAEASEGAYLGPFPRRTGTRARDGPRWLPKCRSGSEGLSRHYDLGEAGLVPWPSGTATEIRDLVWDGEARSERHESTLATRSSFFTPHALKGVSMLRLRLLGENLG